MASRFSSIRSFRLWDAERLGILPAPLTFLFEPCRLGPGEESSLDPLLSLLETKRVLRSDRAWVQELRAPEGPSRRDALADLRDYLRKTLARGFGHQLTAFDLEDLTQDSLLKIHQKLDSFEEQSRFTTWSAAIAINAALSELRRRRYQHVGLEDAAAQAAATLIEEPASRTEADEAVLRRAILEALTERQREAILAKLAGLPLMELARRWGTSQGAVYKMLHDARRRIKRYVEAAEQEGGTLASAGGGTE
jgi:RNA polymerase sigma-70 factor, ECF subfamily